jgi:dnd system-associated protein 4
MSDYSIKIAKDKADLVVALKEQPTTPFETYADVMVFAASLGYSRNKLIPFTKPAAQPEAIRLNTFSSRGYDTAINLLAISHTKNQKVLGNDE